jgi:hypothetical protein
MHTDEILQNGIKIKNVARDLQKNAWYVPNDEVENILLKIEQQELSSQKTTKK